MLNCSARISGAAPYPCDVCGKGFRSSSERKQHLRSKLVHLKKNWKCVACGKRFKQEKVSVKYCGIL